jgi:hypothetical protein
MLRLKAKIKSQNLRLMFNFHVYMNISAECLTKIFKDD